MDKPISIEDRPRQNWFGKNLRRNFLAGLLVLVPVTIVIFVILWFFHAIDGILQPVIRLLFGHTITGLGFAITFVLIYLVGVLASNIVGRRIIQFGEWLVCKLPVLGQLYNAAKQAMSSISGLSRTKAAFREVVLIEYPRKGLRSIGFVTNEIIDSGGRKLTAVYLPTTPVPTSGWLILVTDDQLIRTDISVDTAMKMVISGGIASPPELGARVKEPEIS
ncbi:hypothetical protein Dform_01214 [Dehalogenimonas formicexedens]|uniref:DUF502 domain-containing protein n=1 Tax=Dehalogenimonas formicexedens TaxID=1839801 RepID=A0A1P8F7T6_9CHLR|nr:DUF502 domain-containing protein [Dehalogenimonas formicexedens]APV44546.1 hypothetical protein Dform_01214 [Dehalogenimonas formicexedens]